MEHLLFHPVGFIVALALMEGTKNCLSTRRF